MRRELSGFVILDCRVIVRVDAKSETALHELGIGRPSEKVVNANVIRHRDVIDADDGCDAWKSRQEIPVDPLEEKLTPDVHAARNCDHADFGSVFRDGRRNADRVEPTGSGKNWPVSLLKAPTSTFDCVRVIDDALDQPTGGIRSATSEACDVGVGQAAKIKRSDVTSDRSELDE